MTKQAEHKALDRRSLLAGSGAAGVLALTSQPAQPQQGAPVVETTAGKVAGASNSSAHVFKGIETLVGGIYIACAPGTGTEYAGSFDAVPATMPALQNDSGFEIVLESPSTSVSAGAPISYNHTDVGAVVSKTLSPDGKRILLVARIREDYRSLLRSNSVFWADNTIEGKVWFFKVKFDRPALVAPNGRIAFYTPDEGGGPVTKGKVFPLLSKQPSNTPP